MRLRETKNNKTGHVWVATSTYVSINVRGYNKRSTGVCCSPSVFTVVWNLKWCVYAYTRIWARMITADDQSFSALVTERDRAVNLRWLEATGELNKLSTTRLNAPMLRGIQGATTRYAGDASHLHRYKHRLRAAINLQQVLQTIHIVGGWVNFLFWSFRGQI